MDPHYLYPPSGTLLMAPLAIIDPEKSRWLFILVNVIAILIAWYLLLRLFDYTVSSVAAPVLLLAMFASETVTNTLVFTNINGLVLLAEVLFIRFLLARRDLWAGTMMGLTIAVKPILAPLLLIALVRGQWKVFITSIGVPLVLTAIAWPLIADPMDFVRRTRAVPVRIARLLQQRHRRQRRVLRPADRAGMGYSADLRGDRRGVAVAAVPLLPRRRAVLRHHDVRRAAGRACSCSGRSGRCTTR